MWTKLKDLVMKLRACIFKPSLTMVGIDEAAPVPLIDGEGPDAVNDDASRQELKLGELESSLLKVEMRMHERIQRDAVQRNR